MSSDQGEELGRVREMEGERLGDRLLEVLVGEAAREVEQGSGRRGARDRVLGGALVGWQLDDTVDLDAGAPAGVSGRGR